MTTFDHAKLFFIHEWLRKQAPPPSNSCAVDLHKTKKQRARDMAELVRFILALLFPLLLLAGRTNGQCIAGCACFPFTTPITMDCTPRPDLTGVDTLFTYIPAGAATTLTRM